MIERGEIAPDGTLARLVEVFADEEEVVAGAVLVPQLAVDLEREERQVDDECREPVEIRTVVRHAALRMLVSAVADLGRLAPDQRRNPHAVVVDEQQILAAHQDIPVLQIAVRKLPAFDVLDQGAELLSQRCQFLGLVQHAFDVAIEVRALHPCHLHDGKRSAFDAEPVG